MPCCRNGAVLEPDRVWSAGLSEGNRDTRSCRQTGEQEPNIALEATGSFKLGHLIVWLIYTFKNSFRLMFGAWIGEQSKNGNR